MKLKFAVLWVLALNPGSGFAQDATPLSPWMDDLYTSPVKGNASDCFATVYDYNELEHVNGRDCSSDEGRLAWIEVARPERVNRDLLKTARKEVTIPGRVNAAGTKTPDVEAYESGDPKRAKFAMIFVHGAGGDKRLASRDTNMGGNFNRLMNLVVRNGGVYYSPTVDFSDGGEGIQSIVEKLLKEQPGIQIVLSCGSAGAETCRAVSNRKDTVSHLAGLMFTGAAGGLGDITASAAYARNVPMVISHGSRDGLDSFIADFKKMRKRPDGTNYPVWMQVFDDGGHGTPIRMIDWRSSLNWIIAQKNNVKKDRAGCIIPNPDPTPPNLPDLSAHVKRIESHINPFSCADFLAFPFIRQRPPNSDQVATKKSTCIATRKEETPGEDLQIVIPKGP